MKCSRISCPCEYWSPPLIMIFALQQSLFCMKLNFHLQSEQNERNACCGPLQAKKELLYMTAMWLVVCSIFIATLGRCSPSVREHTATICRKAVTTSVSSQRCGKACWPECILKCNLLCSQDSRVQVFSHWPRSYCPAQPPHCVAFEPFSFISPSVQTKDAALQSMVTQQVCACHSFPQELPDHHGHHLTAWQERTTSPQQCRAYTCRLTITWTGFRRWRRESQGWWAHTALCWAEHCLAGRALQQCDSILMTHLCWTPTTSLYCAKLPFVLLSASHPALKRWAPGLDLLSSKGMLKFV